ncbi:hypothetical protein LCGC14_1867310 [marine sediment metagenome]|uniref:Uncharacterized protein n=1 Tax=marine sediment metagenome TaxID=412755 RepID=A0A0F9G5X6_9ZZZZ
MREQIHIGVQDLYRAVFSGDRIVGYRYNDAGQYLVYTEIEVLGQDPITKMWSTKMARNGHLLQVKDSAYII